MVAGSEATPSETRLQQRPIHLDRYQLTEELGRGAYGQVFKATDTRTGEIVAIKRLALTGISAETLQNITTEIELLKNLNHPYIVSYVGSFKTREYFCIVLEYMDRGALSSVIKRQQNEAFDEAVVAVCIEQVLSGLVYLHKQGVVHRDIKGANILTNREGLVKLADFGVAAKLSGVDEGIEAQNVVGTTYWMAPEVIEMTGVSSAADIWSVGCLAIELLTGAPPYYELQPMPALFRIVQDSRPPLPANISPHLEDFLVKCFHKDPALRPSAQSLLQHPFIKHNRRTLKSSWTRTMASRKKGALSEERMRIDAVVERILKADEGSSTTSVESATTSGLASPKTGTWKLQASGYRSRSDGTMASSAPQGDASLTGTSQLAASGGWTRAASVPEASSPVSDGIARTSASAAATGSSPSAGGLGARGTPPGRGSSGRGDQMGNIFSQRSSASVAVEQQDPLLVLLDRLNNGSGDAHLDALSTSVPQSPRTPFADGQRMLYGQLVLDPGLLEVDPMARRQVDQEIRELVSALRAPLAPAPVVVANGTASLEAIGQREGVIGKAQHALSVLKELLQPSGNISATSGRLAAFVAEGGHVALMEILTSTNPASIPLVEPTLTLIRVAGMKNSYILEQWCLMGMVPVIIRFSQKDKPSGYDDMLWRKIRRECAFIIQNMCFSSTGPAACRVLVACQALPALVEFIEAEPGKELGGNTHNALGCLWFLLAQHDTLPLGVMCRLLAHYGISDRLVRSLAKLVLREQSRGHRTQKPLQPAPSLLTVSGGSSASSGGGVAHNGGAPEHKSLLNSDILISRAAATTRELTAVHAAARAGGLQPTNSFGNDSSEQLMDSMCKLLLVLSHADAAVKEQMCSGGVLVRYLDVIQGIGQLALQALLLRSVSVVRALSRDPAVLAALEKAGTIDSLMPLLTGVPVVRPLPVQLEVLHTINNLCKLKSDRDRREAAAHAGIIPVLVRLAQPADTPDYDPADMVSTAPAGRDALHDDMRQLAVPLLCLMTQPGNIELNKGRLTQAGAMPVLLDLLREELWQHNAMEALANWLAEDPYAVQKELCTPNALSRFVVLFKDKIVSGDMIQLTKLLGPFLRITKASPQFTVEISQHGFVPVVLELLKKQHAPAQRDLLSVIHVIYEHYPRPKDLIVKYRLKDHLKVLATSRSGADAAVLVQKQAQHLLKAFEFNLAL